MKSNAMNQILEGLVGTIANDQLSYPQSLTFWLRAMKECVNFNGRFVEDDHVLGVAPGVDGTTNGTAVKGDATWLYGALGTNIDTDWNIGLITNHATFNPGTTALDYVVALSLPAAASTTPTASGCVFFPFWYCDAAVGAFGVQQSDYDTAASASTVNLWIPYRNQ